MGAGRPPQPPHAQADRDNPSSPTQRSGTIWSPAAASSAAPRMAQKPAYWPPTIDRARGRPVPRRATNNAVRITRSSIVVPAKATTGAARSEPLTLGATVHRGGVARSWGRHVVGPQRPGLPRPLSRSRGPKHLGRPFRPLRSAKILRTWSLNREPRRPGRARYGRRQEPPPRPTGAGTPRVPRRPGR